ncbi:MAG: hypothetical protein C5B56_08445 [Proteobacteria bacterium]|nr:MAG: hypothetical protein C5B56_08445 [Pseudomonadota bacterium]
MIAQPRRHLLTVAAVVAALPSHVSVASAHGFGQRYDLPIPLSFYLWGAGLTVALSFVVLALFLTSERAARPLPTLVVPLPAAIERLARVCGAALGLVGFVAVLIAGFFGEQNPMRNLAPVMVWIIAWVGLSFLSAALGPVWHVINPWATLYRAVGSFVGAQKNQRAAPTWIGVWPSFVLFVIFAWMELVWSGRNVPADLATALAIYSVLAFAGMAWLGREAWLRSGEVFTQVFDIFARFAPVTARAGVLALRVPASGLIDPPASASMAALVIAVLATVTFDGLLETPLWARLDLAVLEAPDDSFLWSVLHLREEEALRLLRTLALPLFVALFAAAFVLVCRAMAALAAEPFATTGVLARRFVFTLVPISLAYHVAHYFSYLLIGGQHIIPFLSDPFLLGWNLIGTASYRVDVGLVDPRLQWSVAVIAVVLGHVIAIWLAHVTALRTFSRPRAAVVTQLPLMGLMVGYTMVSLWILSQPIVETGG